MICLVCSKKFGEDGRSETCPVCGFHSFDIIGDPKIEIPKYKHKIDAHRKSFLSRSSAGFVAYYWKIESGALKKKNTEKMSFGSLLDIYGKTVWIEKSFDCLAKRDNVNVPIEISTPDKTYNHTVSVPSGDYGATCSLGITVDENFNFALVVREKDKKEIFSEKKYLFE